MNETEDFVSSYSLEDRFWSWCFTSAEFATSLSLRDSPSLASGCDSWRMVHESWKAEISRASCSRSRILVSSVRFFLCPLLQQRLFSAPPIATTTRLRPAAGRGRSNNLKNISDAIGPCSTTPSGLFQAEGSSEQACHAAVLINEVRSWVHLAYDRKLVDQSPHNSRD